MPISIDAVLALARGLIPPPPDPVREVFSAAPLPETSRFLLALDSSGHIGVLISVPAITALPTVQPILMRGIGIRFDVPCQVQTSPDTKRDGLYTIVACRSDDPNDQELFLRVMTSFARMADVRFDANSVRVLLEHLVQLFLALETPAKTTVQGLWGELFLISHSDSPPSLVDAWHNSPRALWDFTSNHRHLEVKSSSDETRAHHFTLEQLRCPPKETLLVASLRVLRSGDGSSILDLLNLLRDRKDVQPEHIFKVEQVIAASLGASWKEATADCFSIRHAKESVRYFLSDSIPSIPINTVPREVNHVQFCVDLSHCEHLDRTHRLSLGGILALLGGK